MVLQQRRHTMADAIACLSVDRRQLIDALAGLTWKSRIPTVNSRGGICRTDRTAIARGPKWRGEHGAQWSCRP